VDARCVTDFVGSLPPQGAINIAPMVWPRTELQTKNTNYEEGKMAYIKKPPSLVNREINLERPVSELLDDYSRFVECTTMLRTMS